METNITISASSESGWVKVFIDGNEVLSGPGTITIPLDEGIHFLTYFVQGLSGNSYQVAITDPQEELWEIKAVLKSKRTTGQHGITI